MTVESQPTQTQTEVIQVAKQAPWQKVRDDYSYLTPEKVKQANQYLSQNTLTKEDLKQIHEMGNIIFGGYITELVERFDQRTPNMMDDELFYADEVKKRVYGLLISDFMGSSQENGKVMNHAPHIRPNTKHIGERNGYIFVPIQVYDPGTPAAGPGMPAEMVYYTLQLKRDSSSSYGWKIYYMSQTGDYALRGYTEKPWTIRFNEDDNFSPEALDDMVPDEYYWRYYIGEWDEPGDGMSAQERDQIHHGIPYENTISARTSSRYDRQAAASYSYNYAYDYNSNYISWESEGTDCANFASQCLTAGGLPHDSQWYYKHRSTGDRYSTVWIRAKELYDYLLDTNYGSTVPSTYMADTYEYKANAWCSLRWGDLVFMNWDDDPRLTNDTGHTVVNRIRHVMVITHGYNDTNAYYNGHPRYKLSGHTYNRRDASLTDIYRMDYWREHSIGVLIEYGLV